MSKIVLITGGYGFLGRNCAKYFKEQGFTVFGLGHGAWGSNEYMKLGFDWWLDSDVSLPSLHRLPEMPNIIIHSGGSGSVGFSVQEPFLDFKKTVESTAAVLEYMRIYAPKAKLVYPSSPAVHGLHDNTPIKTSDPLCPVSPYGLHKKMAEELCLQYAREYKINVSVVRFFSIYGNGLKKQLLWDACNKIVSAEGSAEFWGTGDETRDFIHIDDAVSLIYAVASSDRPMIVNGGSGMGRTVSDILHMLRDYLRPDVKIVFNGHIKIGDPKYYTADISNIDLPNWNITISLADGLKGYAYWFLNDKQ